MHRVQRGCCLGPSVAGGAVAVVRSPARQARQPPPTEEGRRGEDGAGGLVSVHAPFNPGYNTSTHAHERRALPIPSPPKSRSQKYPPFLYVPYLWHTLNKLCHLKVEARIFPEKNTNTLGAEAAKKVMKNDSSRFRFRFRAMEKEKLGTIRHSITQGRVRREGGVVKTKLGFPQKNQRGKKASYLRFSLPNCD